MPTMVLVVSENLVNRKVDINSYLSLSEDWSRSSCRAFFTCVMHQSWTPSVTSFTNNVPNMQMRKLRQ